MADIPGEITGGTECYGRRYPCGDPFNLGPLMFSSRSQLLLLSVLLVTKNHAFTTDYPTNIFVERQ